jgi:hypothetical protein
MSGERRDGDLHRLRQDVLDADNARILRIVQVVDALPVRGEADALIAPLRSRLAVLRPARPLTLTRLLYLPLDPLIVARPHWRAGSPGIPRTLLQPLASLVTEKLGPVAAQVQARIAGRDTSATELVAAAGAVLWPDAADVLRQCHPPATFASAAAIGAEQVTPLLRAMAALLDHGAALYRLGLHPDAAADPTLAETLLAAAVRDGAAAMDMMLALLLAQTTDAGQVLRLAEDLASRSGLPAPERALDFLLGAYAEGDAASERIPAGAAAMRRVAILLDGMERQPGQRPPRTAKLERVRRRLNGACRERFEVAADTLARMLPDAGKAGAAAAPPGDAEVEGIEAAALELRRLEAVGRRVGGAGFDDTPLRRAAERLAAAGSLPPVDRLRLAEILLGPDAALALAERAGLDAWD